MPSRDPRRERREESSHCNYLVADKVQTNHLGHRTNRSVTKMTLHGVSHHSPKFVKGLSLSGNRMTDRYGRLEESTEIVKTDSVAGNQQVVKK